MNCPHCGKPIGINVGGSSTALRFHVMRFGSDCNLSDIKPELSGMLQDSLDFDVDIVHELVLESTTWEARCPHCHKTVSDDVCLAILKEETTTAPEK